jgi:hypothetical protein
VTLTGSTVVSGHFDATLNPSDIVAANSTNKFLTNVAPGSIKNSASAFNNICPNAYINKTSWTDIDGVPRQLTGEGNPGEIWKGSSIGPTFDGRLGVDVSAPGSDLVTTYNPKGYYATHRNNLINDGGGLYGIAGAVSAANPVVTGIIALMLQANPTLDAAQIRQILQQTARSDSFTGTTPNTTWGYGKIDAQAAVLRAAMSPCTASALVQCMNNSRFRIQVYWRVPSQGTAGMGTAVRLTGDTCYFWFFSDNNVELVLKVVDGRAFNNRFWVFYGALSDVEYVIRVTDTVTGVIRIYNNPQGNLASVADTAAFAGSALAPETPPESASPPPPPALTAAGEASCASGPSALCLNSSRFRVDVKWRVPSQGTSGTGSAVALTGDTGYFWFFSSNNVELVIKVVDGRAFNNHFWVFYGALSDVEYTITVTDTTTGSVKTYFNPSGSLASVADVSAF